MIRFFAFLLSVLFAQAAFAQTNINLGGISADTSAPVEISADSLNIDQDTGTAVFSGNVVIGQGELRLSAGQVQVTYGDTTGSIARLQASGGATFVTKTEAANAQQADYDIAGGELTLIGEVLLTQGQSAISADRMVINLRTGAAQMTGRVRTVFQQGDN